MFLTHFVSSFNWSWQVILIFLQIPTSFKNCLEFFWSLQTQTTCLRIEVKPERSRKLCHIFSHRTRHNVEKYFQREHSCYHAPKFSSNWIQERATLCNEQLNEITMNWIKYALTCMAHGQIDSFHRTRFLIAKFCDFFNLS